MLLATNGAMRPDEVLEMRADFACWLINGMVTLQVRREAAAAAAIAPPPPRDQRRDRRSIGSLDELGAFLGRRKP